MSKKSYLLGRTQQVLKSCEDAFKYMTISLDEQVTNRESDPNWKPKVLGLETVRFLLDQNVEKVEEIKLLREEIVEFFKVTDQEKELLKKFKKLSPKHRNQLLEVMDEVKGQNYSPSENKDEKH